MIYRMKFFNVSGGANLMRDQNWLEDQLQYLLKNYFANVKITNPVEIKFGREAKFRFGSIRLVSTKSTRGIRSIRGLLKIAGTPKKSIITITSMFGREDIPVNVVRYTIAHELCHYAHGFSSANKRLFRHPHHGGVVNRELRERGAHELTRAFKKWLKGYRRDILAKRTSL